MWVTAAEVQNAWIGDNTPDDTASLDVWIGRAERMIRRRIPDLEDRIDAEIPQPNGDLLLALTVKDVVIDMVTEVFRNPEGIRQANITTGPYTESRTYSGDVPGRLVLTDQHLEDLTGNRVGQSAFVIDLMPPQPEPPSILPPYWDQPDTWV